MRRVRGQSDIQSGKAEYPQHRDEPHRPSIVLSVGSLRAVHAYKGIDTVIRAMPRILEAAPHARYTVVGDGDYRPQLERLALSTGVGAQVTFAGEVTDAELVKHYRSCSLFVLPSRASERASGQWEGEGFGRVYVEAALAGKPVVGSRDGGAAEAVLEGKTGLLVNPCSPTEVADAVTGLLKSPARAAAMGTEGQRWALEEFTERTMRHELSSILHGFGLPAKNGRRSGYGLELRADRAR
jgi:phosphatidylinositol alpha-1,6-mannosyltransferase